MPICVFQNAEDSEVLFSKPVQAGKVNVPVVEKSKGPATPPRRYGSVEDLLEGADTETSGAKVSIAKDGGVTVASVPSKVSNQSFAPPSAPPPPADDYSEFAFVPPSDGSFGGPSAQLSMYLRESSDLVDSRIRRYKYSCEHLELLCTWLNSLKLIESKVTIYTLHQSFCSGILLARLMAHLIPGTKYLQLTEKPLTRKAAIDNLEQALGVVWRSKCVNHTRIATANEIYDGNIPRIVSTVQELFEVYVYEPLCRQSGRIMQWCHSMLKQYMLPVPESILRGDPNGIWSFFQSGVALFCIIHHLFGPIAVGQGANIVRIDAMRVHWSPLRLSEYRSNLKYVFELMAAIKIPLLWSPDRWLCYEDDQFVLLQFQIIYEALKQRQCSLAPAQGHSAGVTAGPNGEMMVVEMKFADTRPMSTKTIRKRFGAIVLGNATDAVPMLPIIGTGSRFKSVVCPAGLVSLGTSYQYATYADIIGKTNTASTQPRSPKKTTSNQDILRAAQESKMKSSMVDSDMLSVNTQSTQKNYDNLSLSAAMDRLNKLRQEQEQRKAQQQATISKAMEALEKSMSDANEDMEELEQELEQQYSDLEASAAKLPVHEYQTRLSQLEEDAKFMEEEKCRLQVC